MIIHTYPHYQTPSEWFLLVKNQEVREGVQLLSTDSTACAQLSTNVERKKIDTTDQPTFGLILRSLLVQWLYDINLKLKDVALPVLQDVFHHESILSFPRIPKEKRYSILYGYSCQRWSNKRICKTEIIIVRWTKANLTWATSALTTEL